MQLPIYCGLHKYATPRHADIHTYQYLIPLKRHDIYEDVTLVTCPQAYAHVSLTLPTEK